ncbi:MAG: hypothetical protein ABMA02_09455 [Saprospiraceae bacterium]
MIQPVLEFAPSVRLASRSIREVEMEVVFGTPSQSCTGLGVCAIINRHPQVELIPCPHAPAIIHFDPGHEIVFRFRKQRLPDRVVQVYFSSNFFVVEEAFSLPQRLVRLWGLPVGSIHPGRYSLEEYSREWRLYFPLPPKRSA